MSRKVLISVLSFNDPPGTAAVIRSARTQTFLGCDVVNVENGTTEASREATRAAFPDIFTIESPTNLGFGGGNNLAIEFSRERGYDALLLCNDDVVLDPATVQRFVDAEVRLPDAAVFGGVEREDSGDAIVSAGGKLNWWMGKVKWGKSIPADAQSPIRVFCPQGALLYITREGLDAGIRLDSSLGLYCEEMELGYTMSAQGLGAYLLPGVPYRHRSGGNRRQPGLNSRNAYYIARNRIWVSRKHLSPAKFAVFLAYYCLELLIKAPVRAMHAPKGFARNLMRGAWDGIFPTGVERMPL